MGTGHSIDVEGEVQRRTGYFPFYHTIKQPNPLGNNSSRVNVSVSIYIREETGLLVPIEIAGAINLWVSVFFIFLIMRGRNCSIFWKGVFT